MSFIVTSVCRNHIGTGRFSCDRYSKLVKGELKVTWEWQGMKIH